MVAGVKRYRYKYTGGVCAGFAVLGTRFRGETTHGRVSQSYFENQLTNDEQAGVFLRRSGATYGRHRACRSVRKLFECALVCSIGYVPHTCRYLAQNTSGVPFPVQSRV